MWKEKLPTLVTYFKSDKLSSLEMFRRLISVANIVGRFLGGHIFSPNFKVTDFNTVLMILSLTSFLVVSLQNIYVLRADFERLIFCIATLGMGIQCVAKLHTFFWNRPKILNLASQVENFHESSDGKSVHCFKHWILMSCYVGSFGFAMFVSCGVLVFLYPVAYFLIFNEKILHFGFIIPGLDWETPLGYSLNFFFNCIQIYCAILALFLSCFYTILFMFNAFAQYDSLSVLLSYLSQLAENNAKGNNTAKIKACMANVISEHVKLLE